MEQSLRLTRMLRETMSDEREVRGLLTLVPATDRSAMAEAHDLIVDGLRGGRPGR